VTTLPAQSPRPAARHPRAAQLVIAGVIVAATVLAFTMVQLTNDPSLSPKQHQARGEVRRLNGLFKDFYRMMGRYPSEQEGFRTILQAGVLRELPVDPWGRPYRYFVRDEKSYVLSLGEDGQLGGTGEAADVGAGGVEAP
jgi:general secretion pathway protein G